jgi:hypothetical protein
LLCGACADAVTGLNNATKPAVNVTAKTARQIFITDRIRYSSFFVEEESVVARDRSVVWSLLIGEIEHRLVDITPPPTLGRIITLDYGMPGGMEMRGRVLVGGIVAAADVAASTANPQVQPLAAALQAFLAAERARCDGSDTGNMGAAL